MIKKIYHNHKEIINNFTWRTLQLFGKQGIIFLIFILCAKFLTPYDFGVYNYSLAVVFFLILFGDFGISTATSKYVAEYNTINKEKLKLVLFNSGIIILGITILITIITFLFGKSFLGDKYVYVLYLLPLIFLAPMTSLYDGIYRGLKKFKQLAIISIIIGIISTIFVYLLVKQYGLIGALISQIIFYSILFLALACGYKEFHFKFNKEVMKEIGVYSAIVGIADVGFFLYTAVNSIILGQFGYFIEVGYYELINKIFLLTVLPFSILGQVISPDVTNLTSNKKFNQIFSKFKRFFFITLFLGIILSALLFLSLPFVLKNYLPQYLTLEFSAMFDVLIFILPLSILSSTISSGFTVATGRAKYSLITIPFGILNLILSYILIVNYGFIGVPISFLISSTICRLLTFSLIYQDIKRKNEKK
jgi:O-antigen/teichoic acid export membrane protein